MKLGIYVIIHFFLPKKTTIFTIFQSYSSIFPRTMNISFQVSSSHAHIIKIFRILWVISLSFFVYVQIHISTQILRGRQWAIFTSLYIYIQIHISTWILRGLQWAIFTSLSIYIQIHISTRILGAPQRAIFTSLWGFT